jgi:hypothetical protein
VVYRCGYEFCYVCEAEFKNKEQTCRCKKWDLVHNIIREQDGDEDDEDYDSEDDYESDYSRQPTFFCCTGFMFFRNLTRAREACAVATALLLYWKDILQRLFHLLIYQKSHS